MPRYRQLESLWTFLRKRFPELRKATVRRCKVSKKIYGDTEKRGSRFIIRIDHELSEATAILVLGHEGAHCLAWHLRSEDDHDDHWALEYGRIYRATVEWINSK